MERRNSKPVLIQTDGLVPMVNKYLVQLSPAQWIMLAEGNLDSSTVATITDMCCDIVQKLTTDVLNIVKPRFEECLRDVRQADVDKPVTYVPVFKEPIDETIASAFNIPKNMCKTAQKLTDLVEREVSNSVNSALSVDPKGTDLTPKPSLDISSISALCSLVLCITELLKIYLNQVDLDELFGVSRPHKGQGFTQDLEKPEPSTIVSSPISVHETTKAVEEILIKRFSEKETTDVPFSVSQDAHAAALDIVEMINEEERSSLRLINNRVENFFAFHKKGASDTDNTPKYNFLKFARKQFAEMKEKLKCACSCCRIQQASVCADEEENVPTIVSEYSRTPSPIEFDNIQKDLERWYDKLEQAKETLEISSEEISKFSRQLTDEMHQQMVDFIYKTSSAPLGSPAINLLYMVTQDIVGRFVQQALLWLQMEAWNHTRLDEAVSDALNDIVRHLTPKQPMQEDSMVQRSPEPPTSSEVILTSEEFRRTPTPFPSYVLPKFQCDDVEEKRMECKFPSCSFNTGHSSPGKMGDKLISNFMHNLVMQLVSRLPEKTKTPLKMKDVQYVVKRLATKASTGVICTHLELVKNMYQLEKVTNAVIKDILLEFESPEKLMQALMSSEDPSFVDAVFRHLRSHLADLVDGKPKKSKFCRFFSRGRKQAI